MQRITDRAILQTAFAHVHRHTVTRDQLTAENLKAGFLVEGNRISLINAQCGITSALS